MRNSRSGVFLFLLLAGLAGSYAPCLAQSPDATPEMADALRADGKIWIVVAVLATIFAGLLVWLIRTDRKLTRMERERDQQRIS